MSISDLNLKNILLNPSENIVEQNQFFDIPEKLTEKMQENYNFSQLNAIKACLKKEGITLIQGPPGTGKTTTILGVLSVLLNSRNMTQKYKTDVTENQQLQSAYVFTPEEKARLYRKASPWIHETGYVDW